MSQGSRPVSQDDGRIRPEHLLKKANEHVSALPFLSRRTHVHVPGPWERRHVHVLPFPPHSFAAALSRPVPLPGWWSDYPAALCVSRQVRGPCVCKGLASFSIIIMAGLATFPRSANNSRGGESGWSISSVCLRRSWPTLIL